MELEDTDGVDTPSEVPPSVFLSCSVSSVLPNLIYADV